VKSSPLEPLCVILRRWLHLKRLDEINAVLPRSHLEGIEVEAKCYLQICGLGSSSTPVYRGWCAPFATPSRPIYAWSSASRAAQVFHIAFHLPGKQYAEELKWDVDLEKTAGTKDHALPVPGTQEPS